ncbi:hypothetical protein [Vibrio nigripulchritudo]|uniref:hypothetical protein n=1 Tax=Vibrio nigripulchritudo TaxID=28173 RepID=UPI0003B2194A|nr:hypothetical protein [Vibrio nigripulchritudo]BDU36050.1 hypothetical protein TUMSATVNIG2_05190 [Vibrio nigripulchritudo]BDU41705.1 hypothetical protein TUMSATVNIG3_05030 [Vibrio nigripulchritudo]CCN71851.1 hypothetical protein VIBNISFn118_460073 [Vibrio nigripulchritudo SFn118]
MARIYLQLESTLDQSVLIDEFEPDDTYMGSIKAVDIIRHLQNVNKTNAFERWTWRFDYSPTLLSS